MASTSTPQPATPPGLAADNQPVRISGPLRTLLLWLAPANISVFMIWGAVPGLLLALQLGAYDDERRVANLALVVALGAVCAMVAQPIAGVVSDRTRSRFGRRSPWIVTGAAVGGVSLILLGQQHSLLGIVMCWMLVQVGYNFAQGPLSAIMPDRVPRRARGRFAAVSGVGLMVGMLGGQLIGAAMAGFITLGYVLLAAVNFVVLLGFCLVNRDESSLDLAREPFSLRGFLAGLWVNPIAHPDFFWAFSGRLLMNTGSNLVNGFLLYVVADYIGLGLDDAAKMVPLLAVTALLPLLVATMIAGPMSDRLDRRRLFVFVAAALGALALAVPWALPSLTGAFIFSVIAGTSAGIFQSVDTALITEVLPSAESFGKDLGVVNIAATLPQTIAPGLAGLIVSGFGYSALFPCAIVLTLAGGLAVWPIRSVR